MRDVRERLAAFRLLLLRHICRREGAAAVKPYCALIHHQVEPSEITECEPVHREHTIRLRPSRAGKMLVSSHRQRCCHAATGSMTAQSSLNNCILPEVFGCAPLPPSVPWISRISTLGRTEILKSFMKACSILLLCSFASLNIHCGVCAPLPPTMPSTSSLGSTEMPQGLKYVSRRSPVCFSSCCR